MCMFICIIKIKIIQFQYLKKIKILDLAMTIRIYFYLFQFFSKLLVSVRIASA